MKEYKVIAMSEKELISILEENGLKVKRIDYDKGFVSANTENNVDERPIIAKHFNVDKAYMFSWDGDQEFPDDIMILLDFNPYE